MSGLRICFGLILMIGCCQAVYADLGPQMHAASDLVRSAHGLAQAKLSHSLTQAAQQHADHLAASGYQVTQPQPSGHDGFGNGTPSSRAASAGFAGPVREILGCGYRDSAAMFAGWERPNSGHYLVLLSPQYDQCGFGHAKNNLGQDIWVALYGTESVAPDPAVTTPAGASFVSLSRRVDSCGNSCSQAVGATHSQRPVVRAGQRIVRPIANAGRFLGRGLSRLLPRNR